MMGSHYSCQMKSHHMLSSLNSPRYKKILNVYLEKSISETSHRLKSIDKLSKFRSSFKSAHITNKTLLGIWMQRQTSPLHWIGKDIHAHKKLRRYHTFPEAIYITGSSAGSMGSIHKHPCTLLVWIEANELRSALSPLIMIGGEAMHTNPEALFIKGEYKACFSRIPGVTRCAHWTTSE